MSTDRLRVAVLGASGYAGLELLRIVLRHPRLELAAVTSEQRAGRPVGEAFPSLRGLTSLAYEALDAGRPARCSEVTAASSRRGWRSTMRSSSSPA